jgi:hypothetical protein
MDLTLTPGALPLWVAGFVTDPLPFDGRVSGTARMSGLARERRVAFDLKLTELSGDTLRQAPAKLVVIVKGTTDRTGVTLKADLAGARGANLHASGRVPFDSTAPLWTGSASGPILGRKARITPSPQAVNAVSPTVTTATGTASTSNLRPGAVRQMRTSLRLSNPTQVSGRKKGAPLGESGGA